MHHQEGYFSNNILKHQKLIPIRTKKKDLINKNSLYVCMFVSLYIVVACKIFVTLFKLAKIFKMCICFSKIFCDTTTVVNIYEIIYLLFCNDQDFVRSERYISLHRIHMSRKCHSGPQKKKLSRVIVPPLK